VPTQSNSRKQAGDSEEVGMGTPVSTDLPRRATVNGGARQLSRPVGGSVILGQMPLQPSPRAAWTTTLPVDLASPSTARQTTQWFLDTCRVDPETTEIGVLLVSELVTNAVNAMTSDGMTGVSHRIELSLRLFTAVRQPLLFTTVAPVRLLVEVIDSSPCPPVLSPSGPDVTTGRGLSIVAELSQQWGYFRHHGRKIVFFTLEAGHGAAPVRHQ
jgi:Histidine kinase-like ATPase domain